MLLYLQLSNPDMPWEQLHYLAAVMLVGLAAIVAIEWRRDERKSRI